MLDIFLTAIQAESDKINKRLIQEAHRDFVEDYSKNTALNPTNTKKLAEEFVKRFLSAELYYRLTKPELNPRNHDKSPD